MSKYKIIGKSFDSEKDYLDFIVKNENLIFDTRKSQMKEADGLQTMPVVQRSMGALKSEAPAEKPTEIKVKAVINSTNVLDSHLDVHIPGIWDKSLKESGKRVMHLQEHGRKFKDVISRGDDLKAYAETATWKSIGYDMEGSTQLLAFDSTVKESRNKDMFDEYSKGNVTEHSVGMIYVKMVTCINDEDYPVQLENYEKYEKMIANKEALKETKVFFAILEAKVIEGSAVLMGSNSFTPTLLASKKEDEFEETHKESAILKWLTS